MNIESFENIINEAWEYKSQINSNSDKKLLSAINETIELLDSGIIRVAEKKNNKWHVNQWIKKGILLSFRVNKMKASKGPYSTWYDKIEGKTQGWDVKNMIEAGRCKSINFELIKLIFLKLLSLIVLKSKYFLIFIKLIFLTFMYL